jgi:hypothetical protein
MRQCRTAIKRKISSQQPRLALTARLPGRIHWCVCCLPDEWVKHAGARCPPRKSV